MFVERRRLMRLRVQRRNAAKTSYLRRFLLEARIGTPSSVALSEARWERLRRERHLLQNVDGIADEGIQNQGTRLFLNGD